MLETRFTELVGCRHPVQLAGMPRICTPELIAAVSNAGGLGTIGTPMTPAPVLSQELDAIERLTSQPYGVNVLIPFLDLECVDVAARRARVVEFFYGEPDHSLIDRVHSRGALAIWQVGSVGEAVAAEKANCDLIVTQGLEAGGHVRGTVGLLPLLAEVLDAVEIPVIAAGGIATARAAAAAFAAGASAVRVGTRFVATRESGAHPTYVEALVRARAEDAEYTGAFFRIWPDAPHRVLGSCIAAAASLPDEPVGELELGGRRMPVPRFGTPAPTRDATGDVEAMALYAGQSVGAVKKVTPAAEVVREIVEGAERLLRAWS
jgi:nitronate monooxygenase